MEIITANELVSGAVVYLDCNGRWVQDVNAARRFQAGETSERDEFVKRAKANIRLVSVEVEAVREVNGALVPDRLRARIRALGTTAPYRAQRQVLGEDGHVSL